MFGQRKTIELQRVVVTGLGAVTPLGHDVDQTWRNLLAGVSGVGLLGGFENVDLPTRLAAEVKDFDPAAHMDRKDARRVGRFIQFAVACSRQALTSAGLDLATVDPTRVGLDVSSALGGVTTIEAQSIRLHEHGPRRVNPTLIPATLISMAPAFVALELGIKGPANASVMACATGLAAIGEAARRIALGEMDVMLAGAAESLMTPLAFIGFGRAGALSTRDDTPTRAITPFDAARDGTVIGEGGAVLLLESLAHARKRGASILAEVVGYGLSVDAYHLAAPDPEGRGASLAMQRALESAAVAPHQLNYIAAHGTGTILNDAAETKAVRRTLGPAADQVPLSSIKSMCGHMMGASAALSCIAIIKAMAEGWVPPTLGLDRPDPVCDLDYTPNQARRLQVDLAMANAFGFGGQNASLILQRYHPQL